MSLVPRIIVAAAVLYNSQNHILLAQRPEGKSMAGLWELPGGKIEPGETPAQALIRELDEELGIEVEETALEYLTSIEHEYPQISLKMHVYLCGAWRGEIMRHTHQDMVWAAPERLKTYPAPAADIPIFGEIVRKFA